MKFLNFLVEERPDPEVGNNSSLESADYYPPDEVAANIDEVNVDTLIEDVYIQNGLEDRSRSIFKVEELINSLPKEMMTDIKKASVLSILGNFGLTATEVVEDGEKRVKILTSVNTQVKADCEQTIAEKEALIEEHKKAIAELEAEIASLQNQARTSDESLEKEVARINKLVKFIGGEE